MFKWTDHFVKIIMAVSSSPEILAQVEKIVVPTVIYTLEHKVIGMLAS